MGFFNFKYILAAPLLILNFFQDITAQAASPEPIRIGVHAKQGKEKCFQEWVPMSDYLTQNIPGYVFSIVPLHYDEVFFTVRLSEVDYIISNPSIYSELEQFCGISHYMEKPFSRSTIGKAIHEVLQRQKNQGQDQPTRIL